MELYNDGISTRNTTSFSNGTVFSQDYYGGMTLALSLPGFVMNLYVFIVIKTQDIAIKKAAAVLLSSQLMIDAIGCALVSIFQFELPKIKNTVVFYIVSILIRRGTLAWSAFICSAYNVVAISTQRFIVIVYPFKVMTKTIAYKMLGVVICCGCVTISIVYSVELMIIPSENICEYQYKNKIMLIAWDLLYYVLPSIIVIALYAKIIITLKARKHLNGKSKNGETRILKNAIIVSLSFVLLCGPSVMAFTLLQLNLMTENVWNNYVRFCTYALVMANSTSTPIVCLTFLPSLRKRSTACLYESLICIKKEKKWSAIKKVLN